MTHLSLRVVSVHVAVLFPPVRNAWCHLSHGTVTNVMLKKWSSPHQRFFHTLSVYLCQDLSGLLLAQHKVLRAAQWGNGAISLQHVLLLQK